MPAYGPEGNAFIETNPEAALLLMAARLDANANSVALEVGTRQVSLGDVADVVGNLPFSVAALGFETIFQRSLEGLYRQEAMVLGALKMGLDKDQKVRRRARSAIDRALSNEWLNRAVDARLTEQTIEDRYRHDVAGKPAPVEVRARIILTLTSDDAQLVIEQVRGGADFGKLAEHVSHDASAAAGGDLGYVRFEALAPELASVIFALPPGQMTAFPVQTPAGFFAVIVEGRRQGPPQTYDEARNGLRRALRSELAAIVIKEQESSVTARTYEVGEKLLPPELRVTEASLGVKPN